MSNEVTRSHMQRSELHKELGADMFKSWTQDHAQEVLSSERYELWSKEEEKAEEALKQLKKTKAVMMHHIDKHYYIGTYGSRN